MNRYDAIYIPRCGPCETRSDGLEGAGVHHSLLWLHDSPNSVAVLLRSEFHHIPEHRDSRRDLLGFHRVDGSHLGDLGNETEIHVDAD